jgi:hypothetical protein
MVLLVEWPFITGLIVNLLECHSSVIASELSLLPSSPLPLHATELANLQVVRRISQKQASNW